MSDYIRKEDAVDTIKKNFKYLPGYMNATINYIKALPSADVVQVVRCKDCEWAVKSTELPGWYMCKCEEAFDYYAKPDDFCSYGKKREDRSEQNGRSKS